MKSPEIYAQLKAEIGPWFKSAGFKRGKGQLAWYRPHGDAFIVVWCQISHDGWDSFAGSKFIIEFQRSSEPISGLARSHRQRFARFLSPQEREEARSIQNAVIAALHHPPSNHPDLHISQQITDYYLAQFRPVREPYPEIHDIWFRYASQEHVSQWAAFIVSKLPKCIGVVEGWANNVPEATAG
jgi:hypothetical protein